MSDGQLYTPGPASGADVRKDGDKWTLVLVRELRHAPSPHVTETTITRAEAPRLLEYSWGGNDMRWQLEPVGSGTRLTLWTSIDRRYIAMGAAGWHICFDVLDRLLNGTPIGRMVGGGLMQFEGWQRLHAEYAEQFGVPLPTWASTTQKG